MSGLADITPECLWDLGATLGEGAYWDTPTGSVWFTDIKRRHIHRFDPATGNRESWDAPDQPGFALPRTSGGLVVGMPHGLHHFDPGTGSFTLLQAVEEDRSGNRMNDGFPDPQGHLWFGSMDDAEEAPTGALYRWNGAAVPDRREDGIIITNGPAQSPDGTILYHTDTLDRSTWAYRLNQDGTIADKRLFAQIEDGAGYPDGMAVDNEGCVWIALFAGWGIRRYAPDGTLLGKVSFPVANVTKLAFGGDDLRTVYATTAAKGLSDAERAAQPLAGGLFTFRSPVAGLPSYRVRA